MAEKKTTTTRKRTTKVEEVKNNIESEFSVDKDIENKLKKAEADNATLTEMLSQMQKQIEELQKKSENKIENQVVIKQNSDLTRSVKVISLLPNVYNLNTQPYGKGGKTYTFNNFGESHMIKFNDMQDILALYLPQFEKGYAVLTNKQDYEDLGVGYIFDEVLSQEKVEKLVKLDNDNAVDTIISMKEDMQEKIIGIIANNIVNGISYDYNKIKKLEDAGLQVNELAELIEDGRKK